VPPEEALPHGSPLQESAADEARRSLVSTTESGTGARLGEADCGASSPNSVKGGRDTTPPMAEPEEDQDSDPAR
jgi:hypothetical protein